MTIIVPFLVYGFAGVSLGGLAVFFMSRLEPWWFIPRPFRYLVLAPFMFTMLEALSDRQLRTIGRLFLLVTAWGIFCSGAACVGGNAVQPSRPSPPTHFGTSR